MIKLYFHGSDLLLLLLFWCFNFNFKNITLNLKERTLDKKFKIRREALLGMAQLYKQYNVASIGDSFDNSNVSESANSALRMLNWIKNKCLHNYINYQTQLDDRFVAISYDI